MTKTTLSPEALEARRKYYREYYRRSRKKNPEKYRAAGARYWERVARKQRESAEQNTKESTHAAD